MSENVHPAVEKALRAYEESKENLSNAIRERYPIGTLIETTLGNATIIGRVCGHGYHFFDPTEVAIENVKTGKHRRIHIGHNKIRVVRGGMA